MRRIVTAIAIALCGCAWAAETKIVREGVVCDGYDVRCVADGHAFTFHLLAKPKDTLKAIAPLAEARLAAIAHDGSPEGVRERRLREAAEAAAKAREAAELIAAVKKEYPDADLPDVSVSATAEEAPTK